MKYWDRDECRNLILGLCARADVGPVRVTVRKRQRLGTCRTGWNKDDKLVRREIILADSLWTGRYDNPRRTGQPTWITQTSPEMRLLTVLHEVTHMILNHNLGMKASFAKSPHGREFQKLEWALDREHGWTPIYKCSPGYADHFVSLEDGTVCRIELNTIYMRRKWDEVRTGNQRGLWGISRKT